MRVLTQIQLLTPMIVSMLGILSAHPGYADARVETVVAIDIGHSPTRSGAISSSGKSEYSYNKAVAEQLQESLRIRPSFKSFLTTDLDPNLSLEERVIHAAKRGASMLVSIHHDSVQPRYLKELRNAGKILYNSNEFSGYSIFVSGKGKAASRSRLLAELIGDALKNLGLSPSLHHAEKIPGEGRDLLDRNRGIYRFDELRILHAVDMPAVLIECGVIVNSDDEAQLRSIEVQRSFAEAIAEGIGKYAASMRPPAERKQPPRVKSLKPVQ